MKTVGFLLLFPFLPCLLVAQQPTPPQNPCEEKPISQRQMNDCAAFEYKEADAHLNKVYRKAVQYMTDDLTRAQKQADQKQMRYEETAIASLKEAERTWISYRDIQCKARCAAVRRGEHGTDDLLTVSDDHNRAPHSRPQEHLRRWRPEVGLMTVLHSSSPAGRPEHVGTVQPRADGSEADSDGSPCCEHQNGGL